MPGKTHRNGLTIIELFKMFPDDASAETWFEIQRWPHGRFCPDCGSLSTVPVKSRKPMPYRCKDCRKHFSVRKGTVMQSSKIPSQKWVLAIYMMTTGIKGTSSMKIHRELGIRQSTAWFLMQRIREGFIDGRMKMAGPVEVDETFLGGKEKNKHKDKKIKGSQGGAGKTVIIGAKDRDTKRVDARTISRRDKTVMQGFVADRAEARATIYTDEANQYKGMPFNHDAINHGVGEYVRGDVHTNGIESFWSLLKRGYHGTFHHMSEKHMGRYVTEFTGRNNVRELDTVVQMSLLARGMVGKRLTYKELIA